MTWGKERPEFLLCTGVIVIREVTLEEMVRSLTGDRSKPFWLQPRVEMWVRRSHDFALLALEVVIVGLGHPIGIEEYDYKCIVMATPAHAVELLDQPAKGTLNFKEPFREDDWMGTFRCYHSDWSLPQS